MNKLSRIGSFVLAGLCVLSLAACSGSNDGGGADGTSSVSDKVKYSDEQNAVVGRGDEELTYVPWSVDDDENRTQSEIDDIYRARARSCVPRIIFVDETRYELAINKLASELVSLAFVEVSFDWKDETLYDRELTDEDMKFVADINLDKWPEGEYNPNTGEPTKEFQEEYKAVTGTEWKDDMYKLYVE